MPRVTARTLALALAVALPAPLLAQTDARDWKRRGVVLDSEFDSGETPLRW